MTKRIDYHIFKNKILMESKLHTCVNAFTQYRFKGFKVHKHVTVPLALEDAL